MPRFILYTIPTGLFTNLATFFLPTYCPEGTKKKFHTQFLFLTPYNSITKNRDSILIVCKFTLKESNFTLKESNFSKKESNFTLKALNFTLKESKSSQKESKSTQKGCCFIEKGCFISPCPP